MKLSVFTVCTPESSPEQLIEDAKAAGLKGVEWRCTSVPDAVKEQEPSFWGNNRCTIDPSEDDAYFERLARKAADAGLENVSVTPYLTVGDLKGTERILRIARLMGASCIRIGTHRYDGSRSYNVLFEEARAYVLEAEKLCRSYGVKGLVETHHGTIVPSAAAALRLIEPCDPAHIGVLFDPGNMVHEGYEHTRLGMELLGPYLAHVHVKNAGWRSERDGNGRVRWISEWAPMNEGVIDWSAVLAQLKAVGYDGYLGVEDFSKQWKSLELLQQYAVLAKEWGVS